MFEIAPGETAGAPHRSSTSVGSPCTRSAMHGAALGQEGFSQSAIEQTRVPTLTLPLGIGKGAARGWGQETGETHRRGRRPAVSRVGVTVGLATSSPVVRGLDMPIQEGFRGRADRI